MASVTLMLKENKVDEKGEMPLYIRMIKGRKAKFISLGIKVHPNLCNQEKLRVKRQYPHSGRVNALIGKKLAEAEAAAIYMEKEKYVSSKKIKEAIMGKPAVSLFEYVNQYISDNKAKGKIGTYKKVKTVLFKLQAFTKTTDFHFDDFDLAFLKKYECYLGDDVRNKPNTVYDNLKILRRLFNSAIREELIEPHLNPFPKFRMTTEKTTKQYLTEGELKAIEELPLKEDTVMFHHRNLHVFACYAGGIKISDVLQLKWQNFNGTHITLNTQKTRETVSIKLPTKALEIIEV